MSRDETFLGRWSRRKQAPPEAARAEDHAVSEVRADDERQTSVHPQGVQHAEPAAAPEDLPAVESLTRDADFTRFMRPDVPPQMKNAALRKLFTDPHFNVMDGLDIYIDDYTKADPIPESMLRELAQSRMLGLFDHEEEDVSGDEPKAAPAATVAFVAAVPSERLPPGDDLPRHASESPAEPSAPGVADSAPPPRLIRAANSFD